MYGENMESIGRDNIKVTNFVVNEQLKDNNRFRPLYIVGFILIITFLTVAYASLAINYGIKIHDPRPIVEPDIKGDDVIPEPEPTPPPTPTPKPYIPPTPPRKLDWRIQFENLSVFAGSKEPIKAAEIDSTKTTVNFEVKLELPGDYYKFQVDMVNDGNYNAKIYEIIRDQLTPDQAKYLDLNITYDDGTEIKVDDELPNKTRKTMIVEIKFKEDVTAEDLPQTDTDVNISYQVVYVEK